jgi:hypothetical protein
MLAAAIIGLLILHAIPAPTQLLWACHIASAVIAFGLAFEVPFMVAIGLVFHAGEGIPAYVIDLIANGETTLRSVLLHTIPIGSAAWALWGQPFPRNVLVPAWLLHPIAMVAAYLFADPALNVMLVHEPFGSSARLFRALWLSWLANMGLAFVCITTMWAVLRWVWRRCG